LYHFASKTRSEQKKINRFIEFNKKYIEKSKAKNGSGFINKEDAKQHEEKFSELKIKAEEAKKKLDKVASELEEESKLLSPKEKIFKKLTNDKDREVEHIAPPVESGEKNIKYVFDDLSSLNKKEKKLITKVFSVVDKCLPDRKVVENIRLKIIEEFR